MTTAVLIFPHQLFAAHPALKQRIDFAVLTEDPLFFGDQPYPCHFHRQKLVLHRASMKHYAQYLEERSVEVLYKEYAGGASKLEKIFGDLKSKDVETLHCVEVVDFILEKRLQRLSDQYQIKIHWHQTPGFINSKSENQTYRSSKKRWFMADFYQWQRKRLGILIDAEQKPIGGQWSFDDENRKRLPKKMIPNLIPPNFPEESTWVQEANRYVDKNFPRALGKSHPFYYPIDHASALRWLEEFLAHKLNSFGSYEDTIVEDQNWLYHSVLTPMLNIGLLTPKQVVDATLDYSLKQNVPLNSLEGFLRQIIGWREFMRATYEDLGVTMRTANYWQHQNKIPNSFYTGTTSIKPIDNTIKRILETGYCHHIERLMVLGGFMFLCEFEPDQIYTWFMEMFVDSYDWVMVPNVYAMSQNADGGLITTKPYFSGSSYISKMSHYDRTESWGETWDALYWRWILKHADDLRKNPRWAMMVKMAENMEATKKSQYLNIANQFLKEFAL